MTFLAKKSVLVGKFEFLNDLLEFFENLLEFFFGLSFFRNVQKKPDLVVLSVYSFILSYTLSQLPVLPIRVPLPS